MRARLAAALLAALSVPVLAAAGPLVSATLRVTLPSGGGGIPLSVTSSSATGSLVGGGFRLDAGSWFAGQHAGGSGATTALLTLGANGALSGTLAGASFTPSAGIPFRGRVRVAKVATVLSIRGWPLGELTEYAHVAFPTPAGLVRPATHGSSSWGFRGDAWHLGRVVQTQLTLSGAPLPDAATTGGVSATPGGNVRLQLVSLSRIFGNTSFTAYHRLPLAARLELVFVPEPGAAVPLAASAALLGVAAARARRRARPR
jgi:hypothetical protein